jgi:hypothetical protein
MDRSKMRYLGQPPTSRSRLGAGGAVDNLIVDV